MKDMLGRSPAKELDLPQILNGSISAKLYHLQFIILSWSLQINYFMYYIMIKVSIVFIKKLYRFIGFLVNYFIFWRRTEKQFY